MEPEPLGDLIDRLADSLVFYARQWSDAPEDVVQEAFIALAEQPRPPERPDAWLFRAVRNGAINSGIANRRRRHREAEAAARSSAWFETDPARRPEPIVDPDSAQAGLAALPDRHREIIVAHLWGHLTFDQIADLVGISASSAHRLYQAGLLTLRERLGVPCPTRSHRENPTR